MSNPAVCTTLVMLDRDGTINVDHGYVVTPERVELLPGAARAVGDLKRAGCTVVIVSNQSAVGRGWATSEQVEQTNRHLQTLLLKEDDAAVIDLILFCPDAPEAATDRRKPEAGMFKEIAGRFTVQGEPSLAERAWMIGDKQSDIEFGLRAGLDSSRCLLIGEAGGIQSESLHGRHVQVQPQRTFATLGLAVQSLLREIFVQPAQ